jgi:hypothetical protein
MKSLSRFGFAGEIHHFQREKENFLSSSVLCGTPYRGSWKHQLVMAIVVVNGGRKPHVWKYLVGALSVLKEYRQSSFETYINEYNELVL